MKARRGTALTLRRLRRIPRDGLEALLRQNEEELQEIDEVIEAGADTPSNLTARCVREHNKRLLQARLSSIPA
ncbi:MAG: hypothetical protein J0L89_08430 [Xanthomonadales bacterium]|nr:hypothetical protein [Xanthomonadales bacterium]